MADRVDKEHELRATAHRELREMVIEFLKTNKVLPTLIMINKDTLKLLTLGLDASNLKTDNMTFVDIKTVIVDSIEPIKLGFLQ